MWAVLAAAGVTGGLAIARFWPVLGGLLPACPFRTLTGLPCPTCGTTRAFLALAAGDPFHALEHSPLAAATVAGTLLAGLWGLARLLAPSVVPDWRPGPEAQLRLARGAAVAVVVNWAYLLAAPYAG